MALKSLALESPALCFAYCVLGFAYVRKWPCNFDRPCFGSQRSSQLARPEGDKNGKMRWPHYPDLTLRARSVFSKKISH